MSPEKAAKASRGKHKGHRDNDGEDRYSRMAKAAEEYNRERVLEEARASVEEASRESTGRRKKRKERRQKQAEQAAKEQAIEEAIANDQNVAEIGMVKVPTAPPSQSSPSFSACLRPTSSSACSCWATR